jgi:hypothetical protein
VDLAPTLLDAAGFEREGRSFLDGPVDRLPVAETLYGYRHMGWAQLLCAWRENLKLIRGVDDRVYDLPGEADASGSPAIPPDLDAALAAYRELGSRVGRGAGETLEPLSGHAYLSGLGRGRLTLIDEAKNRKLRAPDGVAVDRIGRAIGAVGREDPTAIRAEFRRLIADDPGNPSLSFWLGRTEIAAGRHTEAARAFSQAFEKGHREARVLSLWLKSLILAEAVEEGLSVAEKHVPEVVPDASVWVMYGELERLSGDLESAERCAVRAEALTRSERDKKFVSQFRHNLKQSKEQ